METLTVVSSIYRLNTSNFNRSPNFSNSFSPISLKFSAFRRIRTHRRSLILSKSATEDTAIEDEWLKDLPDKKKPLYSHSLPGIEAWLKQLGFFQKNDDKAVWYIEKPDWHAKLSLDLTDLYISQQAATQPFE